VNKLCFKRPCDPPGAYLTFLFAALEGVLQFRRLEGKLQTGCGFADVGRTTLDENGGARLSAFVEHNVTILVVERKPNQLPPLFQAAAGYTKSISRPGFGWDS